jgi:hypothetical protein
MSKRFVPLFALGLLAAFACDPPASKPCASSADCSGATFCTVESGVCNPPPGCNPPDVVCPAVCYGTCEPKPSGERCGPNVCQAGEFCCNESCGICAPRGGACTQQLCEPPQCRTNADCRTFAFTCTGCDCLALGPGDPEPKCPTPGVQCFADPCLNKAAVCEAGRCAIASLSCDAGFVARRVCTACGPAGGCAAVADCARVCTQNADCAADNLPCTDGLCQVVGCI